MFTRIIPHIGCASLLIFCLALPGITQVRYNQFYSIENVLSRELIKSITKDNQGYLWIATDDGVLRYDGFQTNMYYKDLPSVYTKAFLTRGNGQFCVLSDFGLSEIVRQNDSVYFRPIRIGDHNFDLPLNYPKSVYEDREGNVWVGEHNALVKMNESGFKRYELGEDYRSIDYHRSFSFAEDAFDNLWIAPFKGPVLFYNKNEDSLEALDLQIPASQFRAIASVKGDHLLIGATNGLVTIKVDSDHQVLDADVDERIKAVSSIVVLNGKDVYLGTRTSGLYYYNLDLPDNGFEHLSIVPITNILELYPDPDHEELWITGDENIGLIKPSIVSTVDAVGPNRIESFTVHGDNSIYYSTGERIFYLNRKVASDPVTVLEVNDNYFERLYLEGNRLWIGDAFGGISYLDLNTGEQQRILAGDNVAIRYLYPDRSGNKWFTGHSRGLIRVDVDDLLKFYPDVTQSVLVRESPDGGLYCGANGKRTLIFQYQPATDTFTNLDLTFMFECPEGIALNDLQFDAEGNMWIATDEGLLQARKENGAYRNVEKIRIEGLNPNEPVRALAISGETIFFANGQGLIIYGDNEYILFDQDSGLPSRILEERGLSFDREGNLMVATARGMAVVKLSAIQFRPTQTPLVRTILVNGAVVDPVSMAKSHYPFSSKVEAAFISLSYPASNIVYQTRISDQEWSQSSSNRNLNVIGFQEGSHALEVRAREHGKLWSEPLVIPVNISMPWYRTWWAIVIFAAFGVITVIVATQIHNANLIRQKRNLTKIVEERTAEINRQKNEIIEQQKKLIQQKEELIAKNEAVYRSQQALAEADLNYMQLKEKQLQDQIEYKNKQITTHALNIIQKNESLRELKNQLEGVVRNNHKISSIEIRRTLRVIDESFKLDKDWEDFSLYFEQIHTGFYSKLKLSYPELTPLELRHCALIRLNLTLAECASIMGISNDSIKVSRTRLRKKLSLEANQSLTRFILGI